MKELAKRLLAYETASARSAGADSAAAFRVCEKLSRPLSRLAGGAGFQALLSRALVLAGHEAQWLKAVHIKADGSLEGVKEAQAQLSQSEAANGEFILVAQLLGLLGTFIGEELTLRLVKEAWGETAFDDMNSETP
jgi:hypothetical protein